MTDPLHSVGIVVHNAAPPKFLGTCFPFRSPMVFLTAAHVVGGLAPGAVLIGLPFNGQGRGLFVEGVERHPTADLALLRTIPDADEPVTPFTDLVANLVFGEDFAAFGFPEDTSGDVQGAPTPRMFRGHFQRIFRYRSPLGYAYEALELNTPCPAGLSGGPVFRPGAPPMVTGVVTENFESSTFMSSVEEIQEDGAVYKELHKTVINYGVAVALRDVRDWLDGHCPPSGKS